MDAPLTIRDAAAGLRAREYSAVELLERCTSRADALDAGLGVYIARFDETARRAADLADRRFASGEDRGLLQGIPIGVKDIIFTEEAPTTGNSTVANPAWQVQRDATVVARLREAGAVITGKLTTMEFAIGVPDESKPFPYPRNPWDYRRWAGGSSSGSASGVVAGMFLGSLGSDTGGSIRIPATYCGITGIKPTFGLVPKDGVIPLGNSLDVVGPFARTARDAAAILETIGGHSPLDACSTGAGRPSYTEPLEQTAQRITVGIDRTNLASAEVDPELPAIFEEAVRQVGELAGAAVDVEVPMYEEITAAAIITWSSESFAYHKRALKEQWNAFGVSARTAFASGSVFSAGDFIQAQKVRRLGRQRVAETFEQVDAVISPTVTSVAPEVEGLDLGRVYASVFTNYWSGLGNPVINIPIGFSKAGLPFGFQIAARPNDEATLLTVANAFQHATDHHLRQPAW